jgi:hypothetical protein
LPNGAGLPARQLTTALQDFSSKILAVLGEKFCCQGRYLWLQDFWLKFLHAVRKLSRDGVCWTSGNPQVIGRIFLTSPSPWAPSKNKQPSLLMLGRGFQTGARIQNIPQPVAKEIEAKHSNENK